MTAGSPIAQLKQRVIDAEEDAGYYQSLVDAFFSGEVPPGATLSHFVLAKWGRKRLDEMKATAALLQSEAF